MATVGLDVGGFTTKVCVSYSGSDSIELHVNRLSNRETPTIVAFDKRMRLYGEEAELRSSSLHSTSIYILPYIVGMTKCEFGKFFKHRRYLFPISLDGDCDEPSFDLKFDDKDAHVEPRDVFSFFVNSVIDTVRQHMGLNHPRANSEITLCVSFPVYFRENQVRAMYRSLVCWGYSEVRLYKQTDCIFNKWIASHLPAVFDDFEQSTGQSTMHVAFLDVGFCHFAFCVAELTRGETLEKRVLSEISNDEVGTYHMIELLADYVCETIKETKEETIEVPSRQSFNIYKACAKALKELSVVTEVKIDCESVLESGDDFSLTITREKFEEMATPLKENLEGVMRALVRNLPTGTLLGIEVLGGGSRVPFVKKLATDIATEYGATQGIRVSLDSTSAVAAGALGLFKEGLIPIFDPEMEFLAIEDTDISKAMEREDFYAKVEKEQREKMSRINEIEQYIIQTKNDAEGKYSSSLNLSDIEPFLRDLELFSSKAAGNRDINSDDCEHMLKDCRQKVGEACPEYVAALEAAEKARQEEIAKAKRDAEEYTLSKVNMDVTLPRATCLKRASANKDEGNSFVADGNVEFALQHYIKALQYCSKIRDATEEERAILEPLQLACHLNMAMCYIKIANPQYYGNAIDSCSKALELSPHNPKALYRRAFCYDKINCLDEAVADARLGLTKHPDNAELRQLLVSLLNKVKQHQARMKKVYARMF
ncbi:Hsp70 family protein [Babesia bovis T2Bo]|uniref:Hsp70 family protein n=1 Tax=Babesia bovis T2Bo TaxID=484906 RepID=UPI001C358DCA|nr:Hsp70 family protein [Babesia bovis T2Bo]EDO05426.2 Hsp70 family protein [Babesia bovis T2Bo]